MATVSYLSAVAAFLVLGVLAVTIWRERPGSGWLALASAASVVWAGSLIAIHRETVLPVAFSNGVFELMRNAAWFGLLLAMLWRPLEGDPVGARLLRRWSAGLAGALLLTLCYLLWSVATGAGQWYGLIMVLLAVAGLVLVEQVYRDTHPERRWEIKFLCLGLGALFAFDLFLFADLVLFQERGTATWEARGVVNALVAPLLAVSASRHQVWADAPEPSRRLFFHSAALVGAGVYLLAIAAASHYIGEYGGEWGAAIQVVFLFGAVLTLALALFSGSFRARVRVLLAKHFFTYKYDYRDEWLRFTGRLSGRDQSLSFEHQAICALAELVDSTGGLLWVKGESGAYHLKGALNLGSPQYGPETAESEFIHFLAESGWVIDLKQYREDPDLYGHLRLPQWLFADPRYWLVLPLLRDEALEGFVVLAAPRAPHPVDWEVRDLLKTAGRQVAVFVALDSAKEALLDARQLEAFHRLSAFLVHDLKNVSGQLSLVLSNAERHMDNPDFVADAFATVANARDRMDRTLAQLRQARPAEPTPQRRFRAADVLAEAVEQASSLAPRPVFEDAAGGISLVGGRAQLLNTVQHLLRNAQEATPPDGEIRVHLAVEGGEVRIDIRDSGRGMDDDFVRERLFRPFQTTKGNAGMGIGTYEAKELVRQLGGRIEVRSRVGEGTVFTIRLPLVPEGGVEVSGPDPRPAAEPSRPDVAAELVTTAKIGGLKKQAGADLLAGASAAWMPPSNVQGGIHSVPRKGRRPRPVSRDPR